MKREQNIHGIIHSREALESAVADVARLKIEHAGVTGAMEMEIAAVRRHYQPRLAGLTKQIEMREAGVVGYCQQHKEALFTAKKSLELLLATIGFRTTPPRVEKLNVKETWRAVARRLAGLDWGRNYLHQPAPEVNKERLLADRTKFTGEQLAQAGIQFEQDVNFYLEPHAELAATTTVREAA